ncbi:hypothetical protein PsYK624_135960 [Phanerochaete sordida]|uniref:Fungal-type protein kinase domain-containing protein n=1 Tax=Phanerochaete sordida TaxID=48140 RepID=A0A9P3GNB2_9APHY|nr:hypothetical protein PsYK624_135960 [Phanerochaete sordida]
MLADMHKLMRDDPARRFVYGFTLEDMQMRLWHVSRAGSFVSYSFDFATNPRYAISFFLPLLLATKTELGLDPTITLADTPRATAEATFDITVGEKTYRTQRLLSTAGGTRWWEVRALDGLGNEVGGALTLKDAWVEIGQPTEGEILRDATGTMKEEEKACFMRVAAESRVYVDGALDQTPVVVRCGGKVVDVRRPPAAGGGPARAAGGEGKIKMLFALPGLEDRMADIISSTKVHHRIVFDEVGKSIAELDSLQQVFECLGDAVEGLQALHARGWVHRGISEDSIAQVNGRGKLVRVEHAVKRGEECTPVTNTSPPYLTPIEVTRGEYLFATFPHTPPPTIAIPDISRAELRRRHAEFAARMQEAQAAAARAPQPAPPIRPRFAPNALHDLEAVFWLALRVLLCSSLRAPVGVAAADWGRCMETRREAAREVFGGEVRRRAMLASEACLAEVLRGLGPVLARIGAALECVRGELVRRYREVEVECRGVGDGDAAAGLHVKFRAWFFYVAGLLEREDIAINVHGEL